MEKIFGKHSVRAVFLTRPQDIRRMAIAGKKEYHQEFIGLAQKYGIEPEFFDWPTFRRLGEFTEDDKHQGVVVFTKPRQHYGDRDLDILEHGRCILVLDQVSNPQNFATILRGAAFFGVDAILVMKNRSVNLTPTVVRYAVGGAEFVKVFRVTNVSRALQDLKGLGFWIYGMDERGQKTLGQAEFAEKTVIVIGAEGEGLREKTRKYCDQLVQIPGGRKGVESLNAGVAATVAMAEFFRG